MPFSPSFTLPPLSWRAALLIAASLCCTNPAWAQSAARVMAVTGYAKAIEPQGGERTLQKGAELFAGDKVVTHDDSLVQMRLHDGGYMSVRPNTEMVIDRFVYDESDANKSSFLVSLIRGGFRSITGLIGRTNPSGYQIRSKTATIGIRGTDHEPVVVLDTPGALSQGVPGLYDKVNDGETFLSNTGGVLSLKRGDVGFAPFTANTPPQVLAKIPDFYKVELKTDARDSKEGADDKPDGNRRAANGLLRPSLAARREALSTATPPPTANAAPATGPITGPNTGAVVTPATPVITPEQKRAIMQSMTTSPQRTEPTTAPTLQIAPRTAPAVTSK